MLKPTPTRFCRTSTPPLTIFAALLLVAISLTLSPVSAAQTSTADSPSAWPEETSTTSFSGNLSTNDMVSLTNDAPASFLEVGEAYQLSGSFQPPQTLNIHWDIADGYYLYQHKLAFTLNGQPLEHTLPPSSQKYDDYFEKELGVYYRSLDISVALPDQPSEGSLNLVVSSQGCADAGLCYPPQTQNLQLNGTLLSLVANTPPEPDTSSNPLSAGSPSGSGTTLPSYWLALLSALIGGVILNLMPCVFPVLSLKALSLARSQENPHQQHLHGWAYTAGAIATFVAIAAIMLSLRQAGQAIGWGFQLQSPIVVALLAYLFFAMGLALSGFITLGGQLSGSGQSLTEGHSYQSSFFTGALATLVASPCTAPFMGGALGYAVTQPAAIALTIFAALGLGMALPFLLLTYFPSLSRKLPKPGAWMETLKQVLAFPLYLTALWLLWVVGRQTSSDSVVAVIAGATSLAFAAWLWQHQPNRWIQKGLAIIAIAIALLPIATLSEQRQTTNASELDHGWQPFTQARLQQLQQDQTPTFVNLTADWCITCLANEKTALNTDTTLAAFEQAGIVKLKGDWTHYNPEITQLLSQFGRNGVPLYLLYSGKAGEAPIILPQILRERTVTNAINTLKTQR